MKEETTSDENKEQVSDNKDVSQFIGENSTWLAGSVKSRLSRKKDEEDYTNRFLTIRKIKDYTPVYIDVRMKERLQMLVASLQHIVSEITPTILLSNILVDHLLQNKELITRAANDGLKRSLASTFNSDKEQNEK